MTKKLMEYSISAGGYATIAVAIIKARIIYEAQFSSSMERRRNAVENFIRLLVIFVEERKERRREKKEKRLHC